LLTNIFLGSGAFGAHTGHDAHIHASLSAIQILVMQDALDRVNIPRLVQCESTTTSHHSLPYLPPALPSSELTYICLSIEAPRVAENTYPISSPTSSNQPKWLDLRRYIR